MTPDNSAGTSPAASSPVTAPSRLRFLAALCGLLLAAPAVSGAAAEAAPAVSLGDGGGAVAIDRPLWGGDVRWVPGDERSVDVWLDNGAVATAGYEVRVRVDGSPRDQALAAALDVRLAADGVRYDLSAGPARLPRLDPGGRRHLRLTAALPTTASNATQSRRVVVRLQIIPVHDLNRKGGR